MTSLWADHLNEKMTVQKRWRKKNLANGLCPKCGKPPIKGQKLCASHAEKNRRYQLISRLRRIGVVK